MGNVILSGDRPTGKLHLGHYIGSLKTRVKLQNEGDYDKFFIMIADMQALTDNFDNPKKIRENVMEVVLDYLSVGIDPNKVIIFMQSGVPALAEITMHYMNLVTLARLMRNPTIKNELSLRNFESAIPSGFINYPISQAADITAFKANVIPVGEDQKPMIEQTNEIVQKFNNIYGETLVKCNALVPENALEARLPGIDGQAKMSKSLGNAIYLSDSKEEVARKVMAMYTDPGHIKVSDPGKVEGNIVFSYLDVFATDNDFSKYLPDYKNLDELKNAYQKGGVGDMLIKRFLINILEDLLQPFRNRRKSYENNIEKVYQIINDGTKKASEIASETLKEIKQNIGINYFEDDSFYKEISEKFKGEM